MDGFPGRLRGLLAAHSLSQPRLARRLDVTQQTITGWTGGKWQPRAAQVIALAQVFDCDPDYVLGLIDRPGRFPSSGSQEDEE